ncbi:MAG: RecQ family ATP-dependent DNA helicase [Chloroflexota bacterium]|nr:RecQ family ATP-dependent DNA helicase [Dehalococcoidia bacterium]MDW8253319.1 RecQ family ATP-dependent DNA helicase [Chloroflexota bacterium]
MLETTLRDTFGYTSFRPGQREIIEATIAGRDVLAVLPTGGGKSLTYQLPALLSEGVTLVISPLIALMKDQVDRLSRRAPGVATYLNSTVRSAQARKRLEQAAAGTVRLLYIAPERLRSSNFREAAARMRIARIVVDEAHCVSEWGHDFRPDYLAIRAFAEEVGRPPILALTATATPTVRADIQRQLGLDRPVVLVAPLDRPNLRFSVLTVARKSEKIAVTRQLVAQLAGSGIVYTGTRRDAEDLAQALAAGGEQVALYHAGLTLKERSLAQDQFLRGERRVIVATNAFGLGIDKPDVRFVIHFAMPATPEAYFQEAGRAGRDALPSRCILLFAPVDVGIQRFLVQRDVPDEAAMLAVLRALRRGGRSRALVDPEAIAAQLGVSELMVRLAVAGLERGGALVRGPDEWGKLRLEAIRPQPEPRLWLPVTIDAERRRRRRLALLWKMWEYARGSGCRRAWWARYFGDRTPLAPRAGCCDRCDPAGEPVLALTPSPAVRPTRRASSSALPSSRLEEQQRIALALRAVAAVEGAYGRQGVSAILRGRLPKNGDAALASLPEFGALAALPVAEVHHLLDTLVLAGLAEKEPTIRPRLRLTAKGRAFLNGVSLEALPAAQAAAEPRWAQLPRQPTAEAVGALLAALDDPHPRVRSVALAGLRRLALSPAVDLPTRRLARAALIRRR